MEHGFEATSLRSLTAAASVNLAAVNYHFGTKEELFQAVLTRRLDPMNQERIDLLERIERESAGRPSSVEKILFAMLIPALRLARDEERGGKNFLRVLGRAYADRLASEGALVALADIDIEKGADAADEICRRGGKAIHVSLSEAFIIPVKKDREIIVLNDALIKLEAIDERKAKVVELRFFGGLTVEEVAEVLKVSTVTVLRDWAFAKAWLSREMQNDQ